MPYVTCIERLAFKRAYKQGFLMGLREGIALALRVKSGTASKEVMPKIEAIQYIKELRAVGRAIVKADTLDEIKQLLT